MSRSELALLTGPPGGLDVLAIGLSVLTEGLVALTGGLALFSGLTPPLIPKVSTEPSVLPPPAVPPLKP